MHDDLPRIHMAKGKAEPQGPCIIISDTTLKPSGSPTAHTCGSAGDLFSGTLPCIRLSKKHESVGVVSFGVNKFSLTQLILK